MDRNERAGLGKQTFVVVGGTGDVGRAVVNGLTKLGHVVRSVSRRDGISLDDPASLHKQFTGADAAYLMIPFDLEAPDLHSREIEIGARLEEAIVSAGVQRVVLLSGLNAPLKKGSSLGAALMEDRLNASDIKERFFLRVGWIMENFVKGLNFRAQANSGVFATPFKATRNMPMVSAADVGSRIVEILTQTTWPSDHVQELLGGGDYTMAQATNILAEALGEHSVEYVQVGPSDALGGMLASGMSPSFAQAVIETARSFNDDEPWGVQRRSAQNTTPTTLPAWASKVFAPSKEHA